MFLDAGDVRSPALSGHPERIGRLSSRRPLSIEAPLLRIAGSHELAAGATWPRAQGDVGPPQRVGFRARKAEAVLGLPSLPLDDDVVPERYKYLAVYAYERGDLGDTDLASYLRCDVATARETVARTLTSHEIEASGEKRTLRMDFPTSLLGELGESETTNVNTGRDRRLLLDRPAGFRASGGDPRLYGARGIFRMRCWPRCNSSGNTILPGPAHSSVVPVDLAPH